MELREKNKLQWEDKQKEANDSWKNLYGNENNKSQAPSSLKLFCLIFHKGYEIKPVFLLKM